MIEKINARHICALRFVPRNGGAVDYSGPRRAMLNKLLHSGYVTSHMRQYALTEKGRQALVDFDTNLTDLDIETLSMADARNAAALKSRSFKRLLDAGLISIGMATGTLFVHDDVAAIITRPELTPSVAH